MKLIAHCLIILEDNKIKIYANRFVQWILVKWGRRKKNTVWWNQ